MEENLSKLLQAKSSKLTCNSTTKQGRRSGQSQHFRLQTEQRGQLKEQAFIRRVQELAVEEAKKRIPVAQGLPLTTEKPQILSKPLIKEQTIPKNVMLRTEQRAIHRAGYNELVASKINAFEILKRFEEKIMKVIEEQEIRVMRKEMVPKAQLMPMFDKPFFPQRSARPRTVPKEPNLGLIKQHKCSINGESSKLRQCFRHTTKAIKL